MGPNQRTENSYFIYSFATVLKINSYSATVKVEKIPCCKCTGFIDRPVATYETFVFCSELPKGTQVGDTLVVYHDGINVYKVTRHGKTKKECF